MIVLIDQATSFGIYDLQESSFIGFKKDTHAGVKFLWNKTNHASAAFKIHTGKRIKDQSRYIVLPFGSSPYGKATSINPTTKGT